MAGSHDPRDVAATSLPRVLAAVVHAGPDVPAAIALAAECSRTTHQSPLILDACRLYAATLAGALHGESVNDCLDGLPEPVAGCWDAKPLHPDVRSACASAATRKSATLPEVLQVLVAARRHVLAAPSFDAAIAAARQPAGGSVEAALVGTLYGALHGFDSLPAAAVARLAGRERLDDAVDEGLSRHAAAPGDAR
jgi:ADP-ribosylglycohydrolase